MTSVCVLPSRVTGIGVIWLLTTIPVAGSTSWANTRVGFSPVGTVPEYVSDSIGAPTTTASRESGTVMATELTAGAGVTPYATSSTALAAWELGGSVGGPDPPPAFSSKVPEPVATNGSPLASG